MSLFHAYLVDYTNESESRFITFLSREVADEWWRFVSTHSAFAGRLRRMSAQIYMREPGQSTIFPFFIPEVEKFHGKVYFCWHFDKDYRNARLAPPMKFTDHISGKWFFIRSVDDPRRHWYTRLSGRCLVCRQENCNAIHVSTEHRTRFCIEVYNPAFKTAKDFVMIGSDEVSIAASKDYILHIDDAEELKITKVYQITTSHLLFLFQDLKDRFVTRAEENENGDIYEYVVPVERGLGEEWELGR